jgi:hypothetical protein
VGGDDRAGADEDERERPDKLGEPALQQGRTHPKNPRTRVGWRQFEGCRRPRRKPKISSAYQLRNERRPMSADILKRKIRNFPAANLSVRIAAAS